MRRCHVGVMSILPGCFYEPLEAISPPRDMAYFGVHRAIVTANGRMGHVKTTESVENQLYPCHDGENSIVESLELIHF